MKPASPDSKKEAEESPAAFYALIRGRVQGVGYRYQAIREAERLKINGWVRNTYSGDVEVWAEGTRENLETFRIWLHRGPPYSRVDSVDLEPKTPKGYKGFDVKF